MTTIENTFKTVLDNKIADLRTSCTTPEEFTSKVQTELMHTLARIVDSATNAGKRTVAKWVPHHQSYWSELYVNLTECGFEELGAGFFSIAFAHPMLSGRVLKVGLKKEDSAAAYIAWCRINQGRTGVPNIHETLRSTGCYVVVLDELFPIDLDKLQEFKGWQAAKQGVHGLEFGFHTGHDETALKALYETGRDIREFFKGLASFDLHEENVMVDAKGNVVITDPVSYTKDTTGTSWAIIESGNDELAAAHRERIAARARERHERNQKRQELRKEQKMNAKKRRQAQRELELRWEKMRVDVQGAEKPAFVGMAFDFNRLELRALAHAVHRPQEMLASKMFLDPAVIKRIEGLDDELQARLMG